MANYAWTSRHADKFSSPYEYCGCFPGRCIYRSLTLFLNVLATTGIYICSRIGAGDPCGRQQEFWMRRLISAFVRDESGATAIEYCLIASGIAIVIVVAVNGIGSGLNEKFASVNASIK